MYSLEQLKMFVISTELGSFSAAGRKLSKAQSAVSQAIANLEIDMNVTLFDRSGRSPTLTQEGAHLLPLAKAMLSMNNDLEKTAEAMAIGHEDELMLAMDEALITPAVSRLLTEFAERFPATALNFHTVASTDVYWLIEEGKAQLGLAFADGNLPKSTLFCYLGSLPFVPVCAPEHPLSELNSVTLDDLQQHRQLLVKGFDGAGLSHCPPMATQIWWTNTFYLLREFAMEGLGWCFVPLHLVEKELAEGKLLRLPVTFDHQTWQAPVEQVMSKHRQPGPALQWLTDTMKKAFSLR